MSEVSLFSALILGFVSGLLIGLYLHPYLIRLVFWLERLYEKEKEKQGD